MDVRGPRRAAAKRLTAGMVVACAAAAVGAPAAMAATVSNVHPPDTPHPTTYAAVAGEDNTLTLTPGADPVIGPIVTFAELVKPIDPTTAQLDVGDVDDCTATGTQTAPCPAATTNIALGDGDDPLRPTEGLPPLAIDGGTGADRLDFSPRSTSVSVDLG